jgi:malate dehydrogenase
MVLGGHGDSMVPLPRYTTVSGIPIPELLSKEKIDALAQRTRDGGAEIVKLLKTGSAYYAPAMSAVEMVQAILKDEKRVIPCSVLLNGEYGLKDLFLGVPVVVGAAGVERVIELGLTADELQALHTSGQGVREMIEELALDAVS